MDIHKLSIENNPNKDEYGNEDDTYLHDNLFLQCHNVVKLHFKIFHNEIVVTKATDK